MAEKCEHLTTKGAIKMAKRVGMVMSLPTLIKLCRERKMGKQTGGIGTRWFIYKGRFERFLME